jgi:TRAP-type C4-dicarboxylate transport system substrate-binding protein
MFVADPTFYASLSAQEKTALMHAAQKAALVEQQDSIALNASTKDALSAAGSTIVEPSADFAAFLKSKAVAHK